MGSFDVQKKDNFVMIKFPETLGANQVGEFREEMKSWLLEQTEIYIFDFEKTINMQVHFYQAIVTFRQAVRKGNKQFYSVNLSSDIFKQIKADGLEQVFVPVSDLQEAKRKAAPANRMKVALNVEFLNPFLAATKQTLEVQAKTPITAKKPFVKDHNLANQPPPDIAIAGVISLMSDNFSGNITLCFPAATFLAIYQNMFGEVHTTISKETEDAAGELLNIIYGMAKSVLNSKPGFNLRRALPTVLSGDKLKIRQSGSVPTIILPFETAAGPFHIEIEQEQHVASAA